MPESKFVDAVSKSTGKRQTIPASWLELDIPPFNDFALPPAQSELDLPPAEIDPTPPPSDKAKATKTPADTPDSKKEAK